MKELEEQLMCVCVCVCVKFCCKLGKNFTETFQLLNQAYGGGAVWAECFKGFKRAERRSVKISGLEDLPRQETTTMSREFVL